MLASLKISSICAVLLKFMQPSIELVVFEWVQSCLPFLKDLKELISEKMKDKGG